jgi:beta-phosphoglucomutase
MTQAIVGAAIWDVDGTLVDTAELHFQAWSKLTSPYGRSFSRQEFAETFGRRNPEIIRQLFGDGLDDQQVARLGEQKEEYYRSQARRGVDLLPGVRQLLEELREAGFQQAIGSSAPRENLALILQLTRTSSFFDVVVSMEDTDRGKPDPQVFLLAAERLRMSPERCVVLEDAVAGAQAAKAAGMKCVAVRFVGNHSQESLRQAGADLVVHSLEEVGADILLRLIRPAAAGHK